MALVEIDVVWSRGDDWHTRASRTLRTGREIKVGHGIVRRSILLVAVVALAGCASSSPNANSQGQSDDDPAARTEPASQPFPKCSQLRATIEAQLGGPVEVTESSDACSFNRSLDGRAFLALNAKQIRESDPVELMDIYSPPCARVNAIEYSECSTEDVSSEYGVDAYAQHGPRSYGVSQSEDEPDEDWESVYWADGEGGSYFVEATAHDTSVGRGVVAGWVAAIAQVVRNAQ